MDAHRSQTWFFIALLVVTLFFVWSILAPYMSALVLAGTLAFLFRPFYERLVRVFRYQSAAALVTVAIVTLIVFVPIGFLGVRIFEDMTGLYTTLASHGGFDFGTALTKFLQTHFAELHIPDISLTFNDYARQGLTWLIQNLGTFFSGVAQLFFTAFLSLLGLFYFLKDGGSLKTWVRNTVPLAPEYVDDITREMEAVGSSVIRGTLMVAILQGIVMGLGFFIFNIPDPTFWGAIVVPASIIPIVGTWLVAIPAIAYLFFTGQAVSGICLLIWSLILVNLLYNVVSPQLMHRGVHIHPYLILLGVLGGISVFGPIGFLMGPLVIALLFSLLKIYPKLAAKQ